MSLNEYFEEIEILEQQTLVFTTLMAGCVQNIENQRSRSSHSYFLLQNDKFTEPQSRLICVRIRLGLIIKVNLF